MLRSAVRSDHWDGRPPGTHQVVCVECGCLSSGSWYRWRALRIDEPDTDDPPELAYYCPVCAAREFDERPFSH
jgi:hypothetical protein